MLRSVFIIMTVVHLVVEKLISPDMSGGTGILEGRASSGSRYIVCDVNNQGYPEGAITVKVERFPQDILLA